MKRLKRLVMLLFLLLITMMMDTVLYLFKKIFKRLYFPGG